MVFRTHPVAAMAASTSTLLLALFVPGCNITLPTDPDDSDSSESGSDTGGGAPKGGGSSGSGGMKPEDELVANPDIDASRIFWRLYRHDSTCYFLPRADEVPHLVAECATSSDLSTKLQTYGLCAAVVDPDVVNNVQCDDALEISSFLNGNVYFTADGPAADDTVKAKACDVASCKSDETLDSFCDYYEGRADALASGDPVTDIARLDTEAERTAVAACLNELYGVDTSTENAEKCDGTPPAPGYRCVEACSSSGQQSDTSWEWLSSTSATSRAEYGCPICLPGDTSIATPKGDVQVKRLKTGDAIWTVDAGGQRVATTIEHADSVPTPASHALKRLKLMDGRIVTASPGHPLADGRIFDQIATGDLIGNVEVKAVELVPYGDKRTYDVLPAGTTGLYWADGVLIKSTLFVAREGRLGLAPGAEPAPDAAPKAP
jgi:hypothetical protein